MFSIFTAGWPGTGLLLLRTGAGIAVALHGVHQLAGPATMTLVFVGSLLTVVTGAALIVGFMTPIAGSLGAVGGIGLVASKLLVSGQEVASPPAGALVAVMSAAIVLLGPGAYSIDRLLFGRRVLLIPAVRQRNPED